MNDAKAIEGVTLDAAGPAFIGRTGAMATVVAALTRPAALVLIEGEAGIGKSRLVDECLATPALRDLRVLMAVCPDLREPFPLGAVVDGLRLFHDRLGSLELSPLAGALRPLFPEWSMLLPPALESLADPQETRHRLFRALTELIDALGIDVLVVEDAHWADAATLDWLLMLCASRAGRRSIVATSELADATSRLEARALQGQLDLASGRGSGPSTGSAWCWRRTGRAETRTPSCHRTPPWPGWLCRRATMGARSSSPSRS